jgi:hypothetical protein
MYIKKRTYKEASYFTTLQRRSQKHCRVYVAEEKRKAAFGDSSRAKEANP